MKKNAHQQEAFRFPTKYELLMHVLNQYPIQVGLHLTRLNFVNGYTCFKKWHRICRAISQLTFHRFVRRCIYAVSSISNTSYLGVILPNTCGSLPTQKGRKHKKAIGHHVTAGHHHLSVIISNRHINLGQRG
jgi:hypothetical protein